MELETQKFLRRGKTLTELAEQYAIKCNVNAALGVVILNYNQIVSPMEEAICQECRALILDTENWNVVSRSFGKFFNVGEPYAHHIDWTKASVQEKVDGSLICLFYHRDRWHIATKGVSDASGQINGLGITFHALAERTLLDMGLSFDALTARLSPDVFYSFELTAPENHVIVPHEKRHMTWLAAWDKDTLQELNIDDMTDIGCPRVRKYPLQTLESVSQAADEIAPSEGEGFVVCDANFNRIKVKGASYVKVARILASLGTPRHRVEVALSENFDDIVPHLPDAVRNQMLSIRTEIQVLRLEIKSTFDSLQEIPDRKTFASKALAYPYSGVLFWLYGGVDIEDCFQRLQPNTLVDWLGLAIETPAAEE